MSAKHVLSLLLLLSLALPACSSRHKTPPQDVSAYADDEPAHAGRRQHARPAKPGKGRHRNEAPRMEVVNGKKEAGGVTGRAHSALGTPYVPGGRAPGGFDCSGLVQWAYKGAGVNLPRTAAEQSRVGYAVKDRGKMRAGDIVAFRRRDGGYHTGIYLGNGRFIHAPRPNAKVRVESLDTEFFKNSFLGARRVDMGKGDPAAAAAATARERDAKARAQAKSQDRGTPGRAEGAPGSRSKARGQAVQSQQGQQGKAKGKAASSSQSAAPGQTGKAARDKRPASGQDGARSADAKPARPQGKPKAQPKAQPAPQEPRPAAKKPTQAPLKAKASTKPAGREGTMQSPTATQRQAKDKPSRHQATAGPSAPLRQGAKVQKPEKQENVQIHVRPMGRRTE